MDIAQISLSATTQDPPIEEFRVVGRELYRAFSDFGFVYLANHGIDAQEVENMFQSSRHFFNLTEEEKLTCARDPVTTQGYVQPGQESLDKLKGGSAEENEVFELREAFDVCRVDEKATFPDSLVPKWRGQFSTLAENLKLLTRRLLKALALSLDLDPEFFVRCHRNLLKQGNWSILRSLFYPPIQQDRVKPGTIRCAEHSDYGTITLLFQDDLGGLEVQGTKGQWIRAKPEAGNILVNMGDMMEVMTNGQFPATVHRVIIPKEEALRAKPRQSFVFFVNPDDETMVKPIYRLDQPIPPRYQINKTAWEFQNELFKKTYG